MVIYHAGSLAVPIKAIKKSFEERHPDIQVKPVSGGSNKIARMIIESGDVVDILVSADYALIDNLLIPEYASWNALFAHNSMVIMYTEQSKYADQICSDNWFEVLLQPGVNYGHSKPDLDPCGYRTLLLWQLAEKYYKKSGLFRTLTTACPQEHIPQTAQELITMLEAVTLDYAFEYESVARQNAAKNPAYKYIKLPNQINLSVIEHAEFYRSASINLPGSTHTIHGEPIIYSLTMPYTGKNSGSAIKFLKYFFAQGLSILEIQGQPTMGIQVNGFENLPIELQSLLV